MVDVATRDEIVKLWNGGMSGSEIATNVNMTRNAVLGLIYRMRRDGFEFERPSTALSANNVRKRKKPSRKLQIGINLSAASEGLNILDLSLFKCRYIISESTGFDAVYCGKKTHKEAYCEQHYKLCYTPRTKR